MPGEGANEAAREPVSTPEPLSIPKLGLAQEASITVNYEPPPRQRPYPVEDTLRVFITVTAFLLFAGTVLFAAIAVLIGWGTWDRFKEFLQVVLPAETALTGASVGFYFGTKK